MHHILSAAEIENKCLVPLWCLVSVLVGLGLEALIVALESHVRIHLTHELRVGKIPARGD